jgi:hypothetical protein
VTILTFQIGSLITTYSIAEDYIVDVGYDEIMGSESINQKHFSSSYDIYTYEEFSKLINYSIKTNQDLKTYAKINNYETENNPAFSIKTSETCTKDNIRNIKICKTKYIETNEKDKKIFIFSQETTLTQKT